MTFEAADGLLFLPQRPHTLCAVPLHLQQKVTVGMLYVLQKKQKKGLLKEIPPTQWMA